MKRHAGVQGGSLHLIVDEPRQPHNPELWDFGPPLDWPEDPAARPYLDGQGGLVIPIDAPKKFRWWQGGQSVEQTMRELHGEPG